MRPSVRASRAPSAGYTENIALSSPPVLAKIASHKGVGKTFGTPSEFWESERQQKAELFHQVSDWTQPVLSEAVKTAAQNLYVAFPVLAAA